jgi:hypothetical protein
VGLSQTLIYKTCPPIRMVLWFPLAVIAKRLTHDDQAMVCAALLQFPLLSLALTTGFRRWSVPRGLALIVFIYALLAGIAFAIVKSWPNKAGAPNARMTFLFHSDRQGRGVGDLPR